jgi:hypothetical protein
MTRDEWLSVVKLSTMWGFLEARVLSIEQLSKLDLSPTDKIVFGKKYQVLSWLQEGYAALVLREDAMTAEELLENAKTLGWDTMARVLRLRDMGYGASPKLFLRRMHPKLQRHAGHSNDTRIYCPRCGGYEGIEGLGGLGQEIEREFLEDFTEMTPPK